MKGMDKWINKNGAALEVKAAEQRMQHKGPKGQKQKWSSDEHRGWQKLSAQPIVNKPTEMHLEKGDQIEIEIVKVELHKRSREWQAVAYWEPLQRDETVTVAGRPISRSQGIRFKLVLKVDDFGREPEEGERWLVVVQNVVKTIAFAKPLEHQGDSIALKRRRVEEAAENRRCLLAFRERAAGQVLMLAIRLPDAPYLHYDGYEPNDSDVWNQVQRYRGRLTSWEELEDGVRITLTETLSSSSHFCIEGFVEARERQVGTKVFILENLTAFSDAVEGTRGASRATLNFDGF